MAKHSSGVGQVEMLATSQNASDVKYHPALNDALRDLRFTNGRSLIDGDGVGNNSKASLLVAFTVIDTLSGRSEKVTTQRANWYRMLNPYGYSENECSYLLATYQSLAHGYGTPKPFGNRSVRLSSDNNARAIDLATKADVAAISIPGVNDLAEVIAAQHYSEWDTALLDPAIHLT